MPLVSGTITTSDGRPASGWRLAVRPVGPDVSVGGTETAVPSTVELALDANGRFTVDLLPSHDYTPPALYEWVFTNPESGERFVAFRAVGDRAADFSRLGSLDIPFPDGSIEPAQLDYGTAAPGIGEAIIYASSGRFGTAPLAAASGVEDSTDLADMPHTLRGAGGQYLQVDPVSERAYVHAAPPAGTFLDLTDTPDAYSDGSLVQSGSQGLFLTRQVDADRIDSAIARLTQIPGWARAGDNTPIPAGKLSNAPSGGAGLNQAAVDARVRAGVEDWAEAGNTDPVPAQKLTAAPGLTQTQVDGRVDARVEDWAEVANPAVKIPSAKLPAQAVGAGSVDTAELADGAVTPPKLDDNTPAKQKAFREAIDAASVDEILRHIDTVYTGSFQAVRAANGDLASTPDNLLAAFTVGGNSGTIKGYTQDGSSHDVTFTINGNDATFLTVLEGHALDINGHRFFFDHYKLRNYTPGTPPIEYVWDAPPGVLLVGANAVSIYEPLDAQNFLPGGGRQGQMYGIGPGGTPEIVNVADYVEQAVDNRPQVILDEHSFAVNRADWRVAQVGQMQSFSPSQTVSGVTTDRFEVIARLASAAGTASQIRLDPEDDSPIYRAVPGKVLAGLTAYTSSTPEGYRLGRWHYYEGSTLGGTADLYLAVTGGFVAGLFLDWQPSGQSGLQSRALVAEATATVYLQPTR